MNLVVGSKLKGRARLRALELSINRYTKDFTPEWVRGAEERGYSFICYWDSDEQWLQNTCFAVNGRGDLLEDSINQDRFYAADPQHTFKPTSKIRS